MTGPIPLPKQYPAHLQLCYRGVKYRPAALQLFVARGGWGPEFMAAFAVALVLTTLRCQGDRNQ